MAANAPSIPAPPSLRPLLWQSTAAVAIVWLALVAAPAVPGPIRPGLDPGWMAGLHLAASNGLVAGKDIVWTYGPLGWLTLPAATEQHFAAMLSYRLSLWVLWVGALALLALRTRRPAVVLLFAVAAANVTATSAFHFFLPDAQLSLAVMATALLVISAERSSRYVPLAILGVLGGFASVIKFNLAAEAMAVFLTAAGIVAWEERRERIAAIMRAGAVALILPISSFALYAAATGDPEHYPTYLRNALEISSGYSEGMSLPGPDFLVWLALAAAALPLLAIPLTSSRKAPLLRGWLPAAAVSFLTFKHGVVRGDIHMLPILLNFSLAAAYLAISAVTASDRKRLATAQFVMTALGLWMVLGVAPGGPAHLFDRLILKIAARTAAAVSDYPRTLAKLAAANDTGRTEMSVSPALATLVADKTVEAVPFETAYIWANHWRWKPRPVFQSYQVCTTAHDSLNAAHLASPGAAELILFHWDPIDGRHPLFVDPLSWRATFDNYDTIARDGRFLVLQRRNQPRFSAPIELSRTAAMWNQPIPIPTSPTPLLLAAAIPRTLVGDLANLFYRVDPVWIEITNQDKTVTRWRFLRPNLAQGILLNPFPSNINELAQLTGPEFKLPNPATAVRLTAGSPSQFAQQFQIHWQSLPTARQQHPH